MFIRSWGAWPDLLTDFGRELYEPWQIAKGKVVHRDMALIYGPLSSYFNALWFLLLGASLRTLVIVNCAIVVLLILLLRSILRTIGGPLSANVGVVLFLVLFAFGQLAGVSNYNYFAPYSHEAVHGLVLGLASIVLLVKFQFRRNESYLLGCGLAVGACFLTKPEVFLACSATIIVGLSLILYWLDRSRQRSRALAIFLLAAAAGPLIAFGLLCTAMPPSAALYGVLGSWPYVFNSDLTHLPFYRRNMGLDDPASRIFEMAIALYYHAILFLPLAAAAMCLPTHPRWRAIAAVGAFVLVAGALGWTWNAPQWLELARLLPLLACIVVVVIAVSIIRHRNDRATHGRLLGQLCFALFSLILLLKMILNARMSHYGFVLAMPATMLLVVLLLDWIPTWLDGRGGAGGVFRGAALAALGVAAAAHLSRWQSWYDRKTYQINRGPDSFRSDVRGPYVDEVLNYLQDSTPPDSTVVVMPEGVMINYLLRRESSVPFLTYLPADMIMFGEERILAALRDHPPHYIVLVQRDTSEYGLPTFGRQYAQSIYEWVGQHYAQVHLAGDQPFQPLSAFGLAVLQWKSQR